MHFTLDIHCHTVLSGHAYSTVTENAEHAASIGLTHIGVSDHGPAMPGGPHLYNFVNLWILPEIIHGVRVLRGAECNIMDEQGALDLEAPVLAQMDFVIAAFHRGTMKMTNSETHTRTLIAAMENNRDMHILGHPFDCWFPSDMPAVLDCAARTGTIIELNNQSLNPEGYRFNGEAIFMDMLKICKEKKIPVIAASDAHHAKQVGNFARAKELIIAAGMPQELVLNTCADRLLAAIAHKRSIFQ
jgi:putative hydrolase